MTHLSREELRQLTLAALLYYEEGKTQDEIATHLRVSRPKVSRLLSQAREEGVVKITVLDPFRTNDSLAAELCRATGLGRAVVAPGEIADPELARRRLGLAAAKHLEETLQTDDVIGVGWGRTLHAVTSSVEGRPLNGLEAVPLLGGLGQVAPSFQVHQLGQQIATAFAGTFHQFYVPAIVEHEEAHARLVASRDAQEVTACWARLTTALVGIGNIDFDSEMQVLFAGYLDPDTQARLRNAGAVGDICMRFFDAAGRPIPDGLRGVVGVELAQLRRVPNVTAVAGGAEKADAILGALRGGYVHTLVTDEAAARAVIDRTQRG